MKYSSMLCGFGLALSVWGCGGSRGAQRKTSPGDLSAGNATEVAAAAAQNPGAYLPAPRVTDTPLPSDPMKVTIHRLKNGMSVYISTDRSKPEVDTIITVRAGSAEDPRQSTGLAHYLEHMLFKGTSKLGTIDFAKEKPHLDKIAALYDDLRKPDADGVAISKRIDEETQAAAAYAIPNEFDNLYARLGISGINAFTADDATGYIATVPTHRFDAWAKIEADRFSDPQFRLFWPELEAVYEEKNRSLDNPGWRVDEAKMKALFPEHGYGYSSGIGEIEHLKKPAYADMVEFYRRWYVPENMAIILAGDIDASEALPMLEKAFVDFTKPPSPVPSPGRIEALKSKKVVEVPVPSEAGVILTWPLVPAGHADQDALEVMDLLLNDGQSGMLSRDLTLPQKVPYASSSPDFRRYAGYFTLSANGFEGQKLEGLEDLLLAEVEKLKEGDFSDEDLKAALVRITLNQQGILENNGYRAQTMLEAYMTGQSWPVYTERLARLAAIEKADVVRVAKQYLGDRYVLIKKIEKKIEPAKIAKPNITPVKIDPSRRSPYAEAILAAPAQPPEPKALVAGEDYDLQKTKAGMLLAVPNKVNELAAVSWDFDYGTRQDPLICFAFEVLEKSGTSKSTPAMLDRELNLLGTSVSFGCDSKRIRISMSALDANVSESVALIRRWMEDVVIQDENSKGVLANIVTRRNDYMSDPRVIGTALSYAAVSGKRSEFLAATPTSVLKKSKTSDLKKSLANILKLKSKISYFGPRTIDAIQSEVALSSGAKATPRIPADVFRKSKTSKVFFNDQETAQSHIYASWPKVRSNEKDRAQGMLFTQYLGGGGMGGLLFQELREARGLAYSVSGWYAPGRRKIDQSYVGTYIGTQADKSADAMETLVSVMQAPVDDDRLAQAKASLEAAHRSERIQPRQLASVVWAWQERGVKSDPRARDFDAVMGISKNSLEAWIKKSLSTRSIISVVGPAASTDLKRFSKMGEVETLSLKELFSF